MLEPVTEEVLWEDVPWGTLCDGDLVLIEDYRGGQQEWCVGQAEACVTEGKVLITVCNVHAYSVELPPRVPTLGWWPASAPTVCSPQKSWCFVPLREVWWMAKCDL